MNIESAREIFQSLVRGINPFTGKAVTKDSLFDQAEMVRAVALVNDVLDRALKRAARRASRPENAGRSWEQPELEELLEEFKSGHSVEEIAQEHGRTVRAIEDRLEQLGLISATDRTTGTPFGGIAHPKPKQRARRRRGMSPTAE